MARGVVLSRAEHGEIYMCLSRLRRSERDVSVSALCLLDLGSVTHERDKPLSSGEWQD